jgi:hypothetical protein
LESPVVNNVVVWTKLGETIQKKQSEQDGQILNGKKEKRDLLRNIGGDEDTSKRRDVR